MSNKNRSRSLALALGLLIAPALLVTHADARKKKSKEVATAEPVSVPKAPVLKPTGIGWGMSPNKVAKIYDEAFKKDYFKKLKNAEPGIQLRRVEYELEQKQQSFRMGLMPLKAPPSRLDGTPFRYEISYGNKESFMSAKRKGKETSLFFINKLLWKVIDVYKLSSKSKWGSDFGSAVLRVTKILGTPGRTLEVDDKAGRARAEVDWADSKTHLRAIDWKKGEFAIVFTDRNIERKIDKLRKNKPGQKSDIDPSVKKILR